MEGLLYLFYFLSSAAADTLPGAWVASVLQDGAKVSGQVASHTSKRPDFQGARVTPSGLLPSDLTKPGGSSRDGILDDDKARFTMSFSAV